MSSKTLIVNQIKRSPSGGAEDELDLTTGVNVLVGVPNTGKSKWLQMIDFMLGQDDDPANAFGTDVAAKYNSITAHMSVAGKEWKVERRWNDGTPKSRVFLNDEPLNVKQYCHQILQALEIPILHYPQGNPYGQRTWPELGWRSLMRHMYRRQKYWGDIADRQPESEQHACILQFVAIAEHLYSETYGELIKKQKRIIELSAKKEQFMSVLSEVSKDLLSVDEIGVGVTPQSLESAKQRIQAEIDELTTEREGIISALADEVASEDTSMDTSVDELSEEITSLANRRDQLQLSHKRVMSRFAELKEYRNSVQLEVDRLRRAEKAGVLFADLKVTHCPVCDQKVKADHNSSDCYLCHRPYKESEQSGDERLELEIQQAEAVLAETDEMLKSLGNDETGVKSEFNKCQIRINEVRSLLKPVRRAVAAVMPPEMGVLDMKIGRLQEQQSQVDRIVASLSHREKLNTMIEKIEKETESLAKAVEEQNSKLNFELASDALEDGMNTYLNALETAKPNSWTQDRIQVRINEKNTAFKIGGQKKWSAQLGGTLTLYFLLAYHYGLMNLMTQKDTHFPGFLSIDFPAELPDVSSIKDAENFVVEPFVDLLSSEGFPDSQVIVAGGAFESLQNAHRIEFTKVWR